MEDSAFAVSDILVQIQEILLAASRHAVSDLERLIKKHEETLLTAGYDGPNVQDSDTGATPLHSAIQACEDEEWEKVETETEEISDAEDNETTMATAEKTVEWLLANGAQWNVLDNEGKTPGCRAWDLGERGRRIYDRLLREAMIRELIVGKLERMHDITGSPNEAGYIELASDDGDEAILFAEEDSQYRNDETLETSTAENVEATNIEEGVTKGEPIDDNYATEGGSSMEPRECPEEVDNIGKDEGLADVGSNDLTNTKYLSTPLTSTENALVDAHQNGVMMSWERSIMHRSASALLTKKNCRLLNIGFGMGIFDTFAQQHKNCPLEHHIVEAHPDVLKRLRSEGWDQKPGVIIHEGTWQNVCPTLIYNEIKFDAIFYDTFAESYSAFRDFFTNTVPKLLKEDNTSRWSFFNGMGADRQICYDVYQKVVDCELDEVGWTADFEDLEVPREVLEDEKEWEGVKRKYWTVKTYRVPIVKLK